MLLSRLMPGACVAIFLAAPASAMDLKAVQTGQTQPLALQQPANRVSVETVPSTRLRQGYHSIFYTRDPASGAVTLTTTSRQPYAGHDTAPVTALREENAWSMQQGISHMQAAMQVDNLPWNGRMLIGRLMNAEGPVAILETDGNHVTSSVNAGHGPQSVVSGAVYPQNRIDYSISTAPEGVITITVNGTKNMFPVTPAVAAHPIWFEAVVGETDALPARKPDFARATFFSIKADHQLR